MKVIIVGGGASGIMLASILKNSNVDIDVEIIEKSEHIGKKLLMTGNGKCNLSNMNISCDCYNNDFGYKTSISFDCKKYFESLGLLTLVDNEGRIYPNSLVANSVLDVLRESIEGVIVHTNTNIIRITKNNGKYELLSNTNKTFEADILVLATGGKTYYKECNSYILATMLSHKVIPLRPSLNAIKIEENLASIENIRCKCKAKLYQNNTLVYEDSGEVLFKKDALSGIVIFQLSSIMARNPYQKYKIELDLLPQYELEQIEELLEKHPSMVGMFPKMINQYVLKNSDHTNKGIAYTIKHLKFNAIENFDYKNSQVTSGGVDVDELTENLESKNNSNLYFAGEIVNVDGICGGYNLHFAFASANKIAQAIIKKGGLKDE